MEFGLLGPGAELPNVAMSDVNSTAKSDTFAMRNGAMVPPMSYLVAETAYLLGGTVFIEMLRVIDLALATVEPHQFHLGACLGLFPRRCPHCYFIKQRRFHSGWNSGTA